MALKFRLKRLGNKGRPFYHIVLANSRAPRDGKFIEQLGHYDPMPEQSIVELKVDRILHWYKIGARPTDSVKNLFKIKKLDLSALAQ